MEKVPRVAIIGVGDYYRKIHPGIAKWFHIAATIDKGDYGPEPGALSDLVASSRADAVMVLAPNRTHASLIVELSRLRIPVFVEKPLVTTLEDLGKVIDSLAVNPALYCSDFYVEVFGVPLLKWLGRPYPPTMDPWVRACDKSAVKWNEGFESLGKIQAVEANLLEGRGPKSTFEGREWLWDNVHGGVLWDLAYHHLALWFTLFDEPLAVERVATRSVAEGTGDEKAETYAEADLRSSAGISFHLKVGKYIDSGDDSFFTVHGSSGSARMGFAGSYTLSVDGKATAYLEGSFAEQVAEAFRAYVDSEPSEPYGLNAGVRACKLIVEMRSRREPAPTR